MKGFQHVTTGEWLNKDIQKPHFANIQKLILACYPSEAAFIELHGEPENWKKRTISEEEILQLFGENS